MAQVKSLIDAECWLPSEFFNDTDFLMNKDKCPTIGTAEFCFGGNLEFPYEFYSFLSSPVHSVLGFTETESNDEEDFLVGFTRRLALSSFIETQKLGVPCFCKDQPEPVKAKSPQSTLSGIGCWSGKSMMSSNGSPTGSSRVPSPPTSPFDTKNYNWDLIHTAAGQVAGMKESVDGTLYGQQDNGGLLGSLRNVTVSSLTKSSDGFYSNQVITPKLSQFKHLRVDQSDKPHSQWYASMVKEINNNNNNNRRERTTVYESGKCGHSPNLTGTAWPSLYDKHHKQHTQHDFLGASGFKRECAGTGVFLPRRYNHPPDPCKKSGCRNVTNPAKTVQSPNMNFMDTKDQAHARFVNEFLSDHEATMARKAAQQRQSLRPKVALDRESLPKEWTY